MKKFHLFLCIIIAVSFVMQRCVKDHLRSTYTYYVPVYKAKTEVWESIRSAPPQPLKMTGKLFLYGRYIFVNELNKGVHIIDNLNPRMPKNISFISIPGNLDIAVKNNTLYADIYADMVTIDITNPVDVVLKKVSDKVFPERNYESGFARDSTKYIVDWIKQTTTDLRQMDSEKSLGQPPMWYASNELSSRSSAAVVSGVSGSMARFTIVNNYLYTVSRSTLTTFNISTANNPVNEHAQSLGWDIETIYPLKDKLFIGSQTGMSVYSIADPASPSFLGNFSHACFRDPVIADGQYAYVTLRAESNESMCWGTAAAQRNELDIVNISNILQPALAKVYDMAEPQGLSKDGDYLFICDGKAGLKIFNAANVMDIKQLMVIDNIHPFDVICLSGMAIVVADEGMYQYDYSNINDIRLISKMPISKY